ncbi:putative undecaprenyl-phosphate N-acetylglucosaminyl 1-phosphate transferase [Candidatus Zixiibacteriota bacterium]|nr:putative undecaprenyl-phosphate N-acetylglucosaminyl 1-phosphate transferase [candidate division Zixibacteria bacterium]
MTFTVISFSSRLSLYDYPGQHKRHKRPTPNLGGIAIFVSFWAVIAIIRLAGNVALEDFGDSLGYILTGAFLILMVGIIDDLKPLAAWPKLLVEIIAGLILYFGGLSIQVLSIPPFGSVELGGFAVVITVLWVVGLSNAINLIDGLDGLAPGVSFIAALTMTIIGFMFHIAAVALFALVLAGTMFSFWLFNRYPARIFLGDCGALFTGYIFAVISLVVPIKSYTLAALFLPLLVLGVPLIETVSSFTRRIAAGKNVMKADRRHIFHYLARAGLEQRQIIVLFYLSGIFFSLVAISMFVFERIAVLTILLLFMVATFILYLIFIARLKHSKRGRNGIR